jgi:Fur family peroxide stress response transcriptional regulator
MSTKDIFRRHDLRCTAQREALFDALRASKRHPTAEELYHQVRKGTSRLSLATVYNTLEALCRAGLARKLPVTDGCCRYDADTSDHLHIRIGDTSEIRDVPHDLGRELLDKLPRQTLARIEQATGVQIEGVSIQLVGAVSR